MRTTCCYVTDRFKQPVFLYQWHPDCSPKAVLQVVHGMAEHGGRYEPLAKFLTEKGIAVYANDHRGHGKTAGNPASLGKLERSDGFARMVEDVKAITDLIREDYPNTPIFLLGHSMGSFIVRHYTGLHPWPIDGIILSGTGDPTTVQLLGGYLLSVFPCLYLSPSTPAKTINRMLFEKYNQYFAPNRTTFDWLSRDEKEVDKYLHDPACGAVFPLGFYKEFFPALLQKNQKSLRRIPVHLPIMLLSGNKDPVGNFGKDVKSIHHKLQRRGFQDIQLHLFSDGRHEMLHETNRNEVATILHKWIENHSSKPFRQRLSAL